VAIARRDGGQNALGWMAVETLKDFETTFLTMDVQACSVKVD
jgi:hypothetical protein